VRKSSGNAALDEAAREGIAKCRFHAGRQDGAPVKSGVMLQYVWTHG
jgi:outer membrane biosynthesis protein TonB